MDNLPATLVFQILSRLDDSADVARCRAAWKTFDTVAPDLPWINLQYPLKRYIELRSRGSDSSSSSSLPSPLKTIILHLISNSRSLESVHIGAENLPLDVSHADVEDYGDDMYLTDGAFVKEWLPRVSGTLKSLSISDFWVHSGWRRSEVLPLVSACCHNLLELELKHAWLSVKNMNPMPMLTSLTLEFIRLEDKNLTELNKSFPNLQVLNLIDVRGLKLPTIHLLHLKTFQWTITDAQSCLILITPNLTTLSLECRKVVALYIEAPLLSDLHLAIDHLGAVSVKTFENLKSLSLKSSYICSLIQKFPHLKTIENLTLNSGDLAVGAVDDSKFTLKKMLTYFPTVTSVCFKTSAWLSFEVLYESFDRVCLDGRLGLTTFRGYLLRVDPALTFSLVACVLDQCKNLVDVSFLIHRDHAAAHISRHFMDWCVARWPRLKWRWGTWEEGTEDTWITNGIPVAQIN
ncbi:unnamed protein product [Lactuca saligna]|uniref:F-box domain-containing protein n=1 Tax=Lactuca saligna TaxID=75948 RepID=A0AA35ZIG3_LACSI|nr:unnamed protein product [Lactuca saligna]